MTDAGVADLLVGLTAVLALAVSTVAAVEDWRIHRLRDIWTASVAAIVVVGLGVAAAVGGVGLPLTDLAYGAGYFAGPWLVVHLIKPSEMGFGDIKLAAALGLLLGWFDPRLGLAAIMVATLAFVVAMAVTRTKFSEPKPFGPAVVIGAAGALVLHLVVTT